MSPFFRNSREDVVIGEGGKCELPKPGDTYDPRPNTKYPMTGLGYTYDWGNSNTDIGASEFIVNAGTTVVVHNKKTTSEYLQGLTPHLQQK